MIAATDKPTTVPAVDLPAPGVYENIPFATYRAWPAVNKSTLDHIHENSPLHCKFRMDNPEEETEALKLGRAYHTLTLEGEAKYREEFSIATACAATVKSSGKPCTNSGAVLAADGRWYCNVRGHAPEDLASGSICGLTEKQDVLVRGMRHGTLECEDARKFFGSPGQNELSLLWIDPETGLPCKARVDMLRPSWNAIGDLKTTQDAGKERFMRAIVDYGYHRQGAFYLRGAKALNLGVEYFCLFPVEKLPPHASAAYRFSADAVGAGDEQIGKLLRIYKQCQDSGEWYGYPGGFEEITITRWEMQKIGGQI